MTFHPLSAKHRTDIWFSNQDEGDKVTNPGDPDSDDDGLTDGQEVRGMPHVSDEPMSDPPEQVSIDQSETFYTDPQDADTDEDGYWDGWIGVYGVGRSENVVLYRHNLHDDTAGIRGDEIVQKQIELHPEDAAPTAMAADVDPESPGDEHSAIHIGERQWGTDPTDESDAETPDPSLEIEADYYQGVDSEVFNGVWRQSIEDNYALYGIEVEFVEALGETDPLTDGNLCEGVYIDYQGGSCLAPGEKHWPPFSDDDVEWIKEQYRDTDAHYLFIGTYGGLVPSTTPGETESTDQGSQWTVLYTQGHNDLENIPSTRLNLDEDAQLRAPVQKTAVHEIGHVYDIGDIEITEYGVQANEVYSGCPPDNERSPGYGCTVEDPTPEFIIDESSDEYVREWSVMSSSTRTGQFAPPSEEDYFAFSIEELFTVNTEDPIFND